MISPHNDKVYSEAVFAATTWTARIVNQTVKACHGRHSDAQRLEHLQNAIALTRDLLEVLTLTETKVTRGRQRA